MGQGRAKDNKDAFDNAISQKDREIGNEKMKFVEKFFEKILEVAKFAEESTWWLQEHTDFLKEKEDVLKSITSDSKVLEALEQDMNGFFSKVVSLMKDGIMNKETDCKTKEKEDCEARLQNASET